MKTSEETGNIVKAMIKVQTALKPVKKDRENDFANGHKYATLDAILGDVLPILTANDIFMTQEPGTEILEGSVAIFVTTKFFHSSGEFLEYSPLTFQLEKGSKMNLAQSSGSVITYIKRYALTAALGISSGDDTDGNTPHQEPQHTQQQEPQQNEAQRLQEINDTINQYKNFLVANGRDLDELDRYILNSEKVQKIEMLNPVKVMGYYKTFFKKQQTVNAEREKEKQANKPVMWGQK